MSFLLIYIGKGLAFDREQLKRFWSQCPGVSNLRENGMVGASLSANYSFEEDSTIIELKRDQETIALSGTGNASVQMAFELQKAVGVSLHVIDESYSFDFVIQDYISPKALAEAIYKAIARVPDGL